MTIPLAAAALAAGCSGKAAGPKAGDVETALKTYLQNAPTKVSDVRRDGPVIHVSCKRSGERYRRTPVFGCTISHSLGTAVEWCVALVGERLVTQNEDQAVPCAGHSPRSMEGPQ